MKALLLIQKNKYQIGFFAMAGLCVWFFLQGLKKDHSMDLFKQKMFLKEEARQNIITLRSQYQQLYDMAARDILTLEIRDSLLKVRSTESSNQIKKISTPKYAKEKTDIVDAYSDSDLLQYFNDLPKVPEPTDF